MMPHPFQQDVVQFKNRQWTEQVSLQVSDITQSPARELWLYNNRRATIVKEMAHINFTALTNLQLDGNRIESVEGLPRVHMAHIKYMNIGSNKITSVGVIRKAAWPRLQTFSIMNNHCKDANSLVHGYFSHMRTLSVSITWGVNKNKSTEQCFPAKMQAASLRRLRIKKNTYCFSRCMERSPVTKMAKRCDTMISKQNIFYVLSSVAYIIWHLHSHASHVISKTASPYAEGVEYLCGNSMNAKVQLIASHFSLVFRTMMTAEPAHTVPAMIF